MTLELLKDLNFFMFGWLVGWIVFDQVFHRPLRKLLRDALKQWRETLDLTIEVARSKGINVPEKDGSILSPIQIKKL